MKNRKYYQNLRPEMLDFLPKKYINVLEIGCGNGDFFNTIPTVAGCSYGVEMNTESATVASKYFDVMLNGSYNDVIDDIPDNFFDLVICNDVIEHMDDHSFFLNSIRNKMKFNGSLVGSVPNVRYINNLKELILDKDWSYKESGILDETHLRFFTQKSLYRALTKNNFRINKLSGINHTSYARNIKGSIRRIIVMMLGHDAGYFQIGFHVTKECNK